MVEIFGQSFCSKFLNIDRKLFYILIFAEKYRFDQFEMTVIFFSKKAIFLASVKIRSNLATLIEIVFESFLGNCVMQNEIHLLGADLISQPLACRKM